LSMPADLKDLELEEQINVEALHFIPYPIDEVNLDYEIIGKSANSETDNDVLLVACRRTIVDDYIDTVENTGLGLKYVDIDTYAMERVAIFDIGTNNSHLMIVNDVGVIYSRHQNFGAMQLVKLIRKEYGVSVEEAQEILGSSQPPGDFASAVQEPFVEMLQQEVNRALQFFYSSSSFSNIDSIVLSGACCALDGLAGDLEVKMRAKVSTMDPVANATVQTNREGVKKVAPSLSIAYGLALRGFNNG